MTIFLFSFASTCDSRVPGVPGNSFVTAG